MSLAVRMTLAWGVLLLLLAQGLAQNVPGEERPQIHVPLKKMTKQDLDRAEALKLFGLGVIHERENRLIEALKTFEEAQHLDPDALEILRSLIPLYLALDRTTEAFTTCQRVLELLPDDFETGYLYARQLRSQERTADALEVLKQLSGLDTLKDFPELHARIAYDRGLLHDGRSEWVEAEKAYREAAAVLDHPTVLLEQGSYTKDEIGNQAAETYERLGRVCLKREKIKEAVTAFEQAQQRDPLRAPRLSYNLAEVHISQNQPAEALARLDEYLRTQPQGMEGYEMKITLLQKLRRDKDIVPELEEACGHDRQNPALKLLLAREYRKAGKPVAAEQVYEELLKSRATAEVYRELFGLFKDEGPVGLTRALELLNSAIKAGVPREDKRGDDGAAMRARAMLVVLREDDELVKSLLPLVHQRLRNGPPLEEPTRKLFASLAGRARKLDVAEELYRSCLQRGGGEGQPLKEHEIYAGLLQVLVLAHKQQAVVDLCRDGLKQAQLTNRVLFHEELARAQMALGRVKEALAAADDAVGDAGKDEMLRSRRNRAFLLSQAEKHAEAIAECQQLLKDYNQPGEVRGIRSALSAIYSAAKQPARAEEQLQLILEADPNDATANNDLGYLWAEQNKNLDEAEKRIRKALDLDQKQRTSGVWLGVDADLDNAAYVDSLGWVLFRRGQLKEARKELEKAVALPGGDDDPVVWDHLGDVYFRLAQKSKAREVWQKALTLYEGGRRQPDDHYRELKQKLLQLEP